MGTNQSACHYYQMGEGRGGGGVRDNLQIKRFLKKLYSTNTCNSVYKSTVG